MHVAMEQTVTLLTQKHLALTLTMLGLTATMQSIASSKRSTKLQALVISVALPLQLTLIQVSLNHPHLTALLILFIFDIQCTFEELGHENTMPNKRQCFFELRTPLVLNA